MSHVITPVDFKPRPWQGPIIERASSAQRLNIFVGMGMGKSVSILTAVDIIAVMGANVFPVLVCAPLKVAQNVWPFECKKWNHLSYMKVIPITGTLDQRLSALTYKADIYCINYENLPWLITYLGNKWPFKCVVCDESIKLKSFRFRQGGKRAAALAARAEYTPYWFNLTGEPCPGGLHDLWGSQWFIDRGAALGKSYTRFAESYFYRSEEGRALVAVKGAEEEIAERMRSTTITIRAEDYLSLDKPVVVHREAILSPKCMEAYRRLERQLFLELNAGRVTAVNAADKTMKCLQYASGAVYTDLDSKGWEEVHDEKLYELDSIISEAGGEPVVVAYHFKSDLVRILKKFPEAVVLKNRKNMDDWNAGKIPILLAHPQSCGHGLDLQFGGRRLIFFSHWWALDPALQIVERLGPMRQFQAGLNRLVYIYYIVARGTLDELVLMRHKDRKEVQDLLKERLINCKQV